MNPFTCLLAVLLVLGPFNTEDVDANTQPRVNTVARRITENNKKEMLDSADKLRKMLSEKYGYRPKADIMKIKDTSERQKAIAENHELFGI